MLLKLARRMGLVKWPPYMGQLLPAPTAGDRGSRSQAKVQRMKGALLHEVAHLIPGRPTEPLLEAIYVAYKRRGLTGDYAEFGVFTGRSTVRAYHYLRGARGETPTRMFAFDSFEGLPKLGAVDTVRYADFDAGTYSCTEDDYLQNVTSFGVPRGWIHTIPGWFSATCNEATAKRAGLGKIAVAHVDCDILSSTLDVLRFLGDAMEDGGIIVFDDYGSYRAHPQLGQRGALARFQSERPDLWITAVSGQGGASASFSVHRKLSDTEVSAMTTSAT
jgi:O-methyltransferase